VGSGSLTIQSANIPAQEVTVTLLTAADAGSSAECAIGTDAVKAVATGATGNRIKIEVSRSGLSVTDSGHTTLESIAADANTLTPAYWNISGIITTTDLSSNVPSNAPRIRFGSDPAVYRVVRDYSSGTETVTLSPAAKREIPLGTPMFIVTGTYTVTVTGVGMGTGGADIVETYTGITTGYDLLRKLMDSALIRPAYTPSPVTTIGGNAVTDLPIITSAYALITDATSVDIRPTDLAARSTATAETITVQSKGNGAWSVTGTASGSLTDAMEGTKYAATASPVQFTIPEKPATTTTSSSEPVYISGTSYATRESDTALPTICIQGKLGINATATSITAVYTKRPAVADCDCPSSAVRFSNSCLGLTTGGNDMALDPAYQSRLVSLYTWQKSVINTNADVNDLAGPATYIRVKEFIKTLATWSSTGMEYASVSAAATARGASWMGAVEDNENVDDATQLNNAYPGATSTGDLYAGIIITTDTTSDDLAGIDSNDIDLCNTVTAYLAECLAQVYADTAGLAAWDALLTDTQAELAKLDSIKLISSAPDAYLSRFEAGCNVVLATAGIVPGESDTASGTITGCWRSDDDAEYYWVLSDGYAPAFTGLKYYSALSGTYENTKEFAFEIQCSCSGLLVEGDTITIQIGAGLADGHWNSSNSFTVAVIPASPLCATGGTNADDTETWAVSGTGATAALVDFTATSANRTYCSDGLSFTLTAGGIPFTVGARFTFSVQRGHFTWFKNGVEMGTGSLAGTTSLDSGLSATWTPGAAPAFVEGDSFSFTAQQPHAASGISTPNESGWQWTGAGVLTITLSSLKSLSSLALWHSLTNVTIETTADGSTWAALPWPITLRSPLMVLSGDAITIKGIRITSSASGFIRWLWAGIPFAPEYSAAVKLRHQFDMTRARTSGASALLGEGTAASIEWDILTPDDADALKTMVRGVKVGGDETIIMIPQLNHPEEAFLCRIDNDSLELDDVLEYQPDDISHRIISASLELTPEWL